MDRGSPTGLRAAAQRGPRPRRALDRRHRDRPGRRARPLIGVNFSDSAPRLGTLPRLPSGDVCFGMPQLSTTGRGLGAFRLRQRVQDAGSSPEDAVHADDPGHLPDRLDGPGAVCERAAGRRLSQGRRDRRAGRPLLADQSVLRRRPAAAGDLRAGHHALHHREHHPAAAHRRRPPARGAEEGGRRRAEQDHPVHPLPHPGARDPQLDRVRHPGRQRPAVPGLLRRGTPQRRLPDEPGR